MIGFDLWSERAFSVRAGEKTDPDDVQVLLPVVIGEKQGNTSTPIPSPTLEPTATLEATATLEVTATTEATPSPTPTAIPNSAPRIVSGEMDFEKTIVGEGVYEAHMAAGGDLDGDGDNDIIATNYVDGYVMWYENDGNGGFKEHYLDQDLPGA